MDSKKRLYIIAAVVIVLAAGVSTFFVILSRKNKAPSTFVDGTAIREVTQVPVAQQSPAPPAGTAPATQPPSTTLPGTTSETTAPLPTAPATPTPTPPPPPATPATPPADRTERCQGSDPVTLTIACSQKMFSQAHAAQQIYLSRADNAVDAFAAAPLIAATNGAYLAVDTNSLRRESLAELDRALQGKSSPVVILGGTAAVSPAVESQLHSAGYLNISRLFGANRYATATAIAEEMIKVQGRPLLNAFLTEGSLLVDAYGIGPVASGNVPQTGPSFILLTNRGGGTLNPTTAAFLRRHPEIKIVTIVGGTSAVPDSVKDQLKGLGIVLVDRIADINRVWTNLRIIVRYFLQPTKAYVANAYPNKGQNGLYSPQAAAVMAATQGEPLLMIDPALVPEGQQRFLCSFSKEIWLASIAGNEKDINSSTEQKLLQLIKGTDPFCP